MKIVHICLAGGIYNESWNYQENMLIKYHRRMGYEVTYIVGPYQYNNTGEIEYVGQMEYFNDDGVHIIRLKLYNFQNHKRKLKKYIGMLPVIEEEHPDIIFIHNIQFVDACKVKKYLSKHPKVRLYVDNHADYSNSASNWVSKKILHGIIWRSIALCIDPYVKKWYGVLPNRVDFLHDMYGIDKKRIELLHMGGEEQRRTKEETEVTRKRYGIDKNDFLIVTGGKIDSYKWQTTLLMDAVNSIKDSTLKLIVFGSLEQDLKMRVLNRCSNRVQYIGWINPAKTYEIFAMAQLAVFPGHHSVFWEQAVSQGIPLCVKYWEGITHINANNNCVFLYQDSEEEIKKVILNLRKENTVYDMLKSNAEQCKWQFLYSDIAKKAIEIDTL